MKKLILIVVSLLFASVLLAAGSENLLILGFDSDRDSRNTLNSINREFEDIFKADDHFRLIPKRDVDNALRAAGLANTPFAELTQEQIQAVAEQLDASIIVWGSINKISNTSFILAGNIRSHRSGTVVAFRLDLSNSKNPRVETLRSDLLGRLKDFSTGEMVKMIDIARQQFQNSSFDTAETQFQRILVIYPDNADVYYYLGWIALYVRRDTERAIELFSTGLENNPDHLNILEHIAVAYKTADMLPQAIDAMARKAEITGTKEDYLSLAKLHKDADDNAAALADLDKALATDPNYDEARELYADAAYDSQLYDRAIPHLEYLLTQRPDDDLLSRRLAFSYSKTGQQDMAIERYQTMIANDRTNINAYRNLANTYRSLAQDNPSEARRYNELARDTLLRAREAMPSNADPRRVADIENSLADTYFALNDFTNADRLAKAAMQKNPALYEPSVILASIAQRQGIDRFNQFSEAKRRTDNAADENLWGAELDALIVRRDNLRTEANSLFTTADRYFREARELAPNDRVRADITQRINSNSQYLSLTRRSD